MWSFILNLGKYVEFHFAKFTQINSFQISIIIENLSDAIQLLHVFRIPPPIHAQSPTTCAHQPTTNASGPQGTANKTCTPSPTTCPHSCAFVYRLLCIQAEAAVYYVHIHRDCNV